MGRWLQALQARENSRERQNRADKTDETHSGEVLSVLTVPLSGTQQNFSPTSGGAVVVSLADWRAHFDERAGIREFDGGFPRAEAERLAREDTTAMLGPEPSR